MRTTATIINVDMQFRAKATTPPSPIASIRPTAVPTMLQLLLLTKSSGKESAMNWDMVERDWKQFQVHVKEKWGRLTDANLVLIAGRRDHLSAQIQRSYGISKDQTERQLKLFEEVHKDSQPKRQG
jgi:uncharacterized protein YjbJ (UPF0337 family)